MKDKLFLQHSIYTLLLSLHIAEYHADFLASQEKVVKNGIINRKKQDRIKRIVKEVRIDLLNSAKDAEAREDILKGLTEERIQSLSNSLMIINQLAELDVLEKLEDYLSEIIKPVKND